METREIFRMQRRRSAVLAFVALLGVQTMVLAAGNEAAISPGARGVMERMTAFMAKQATFAIASDVTRDEVAAYGYKLQHQEHADIVVQRPARLRASIVGDLADRTIVYDGRNLAMYAPEDRAYVRIAAPDTLAALLDGLLDAGVDLPLADVLFQATEGTLTDGVERGVQIGTATIDGELCDHLAFRHPNVDWQLWVARGDRPLPRKLVITTRYEVGEPQFQATLRWDLAPKIDAGTFAFDAPDGSVEISFDNTAALRGGAR